MPERVKEAIDRAIEDGAIFDDIDGMTASRKLKDFIRRKLTQPQGWSLRSIQEDLQEEFGVSEKKAGDIARTEPASVLNNAREDVFEEMSEELDEEPRFKWIGPGQPDDGRTTECCQEMKELTDPKHGGEPRTMDELVELEREVHAKHFPDLEFRKHCLHPGERHTFTEVVDMKAHPGVDSFEVRLDKWPGTFEVANT